MNKWIYDSHKPWWPSAAVPLCFGTIKDTLFSFITGDVSADYRGYGPQEGPGAGIRYTSFNTGAIGGGHGGRGGRGSAGLRASFSYDSIYEPTQYGSGGGNGLNHVGGRGGGRIVFEISEMLRLEGRVHASGEPRSGDNPSGGGAGGSIVIRALNFDGEGSVTVNGGSCFSSASPYGGGGAGGRIAVYYNGNYTYIGSYQSYGGTSQAERGGAGTVYIQNNRNASQPYRILRIDNRVMLSGPSKLHEINELDLTGNTAGNSFACSLVLSFISFVPLIRSLIHSS